MEKRAEALIKEVTSIIKKCLMVVLLTLYQYTLMKNMEELYRKYYLESCPDTYLHWTGRFRNR